MAPLPSEPYKGVRDFYPADWSRMNVMWNRIRGVLTSRGYEEYNASPLERTELYENKGNEEIVNEQTYTFTDRGERSVTLRPEMTPTLARMVAGKRRELAFPLRWYSIGNRFRYERPQKGRLREFYQCDIDLLGLPEGEADVEILTLASEVLRAFGAQEADFTIKINSRAMLTAACRAAGYTDADAMREFWRLLDKKAKMSAEEFTAARGDMKDPLAVIEESSDPEVAREKAKILAMIETLKARGITNAVYDPEVVRGFDYYTGMIFEIFDTNPENARSIFGGGRYDGLVSLFGGDPIPAVGFALGDVTFMDFLATHGYEIKPETPADVYIATPSAEDRDAARIFTEGLRVKGVRAFLNLTEKNLGDQVKDAVKRNIPSVIAFGKNEQDSGEVKIKTLETGTEESVSFDEAASRLRRRS
jgi:histidyl-tRNA synthetase